MSATKSLRRKPHSGCSIEDGKLTAIPELRINNYPVISACLQSGRPLALFGRVLSAKRADSMTVVTDHSKLVRLYGTISNLMPEDNSGDKWIITLNLGGTLAEQYGYSVQMFVRTDPQDRLETLVFA